ncbi:hypothetical protein [Microbacterium sp. NPDC089696]|uniref:hypothetical protein n=1 Tax=Microbacterium sp. NPDC089696 TaxID=3364199 RepID=UPI00382C2930
MTFKKKIASVAAGAALVAGLVAGVPLAAQAASWMGPYVDGSHCQADRRLFMQEGYSVGSCTTRSGQPGFWFSYS